ncbi:MULTISPECIES: AAA family ATPase [Stenotrophomonas]|uniref:AAA family ATPase n=1 Tax=Stenotrophomonas TaxID=40323 RepID=UPI000AD1C45C|nr:AAA family ATPase [Stenotrophomonas maltophilia]HEL4846211.1 AAA family ATPase [Stenotrophomonas maltophilia]
MKDIYFSVVAPGTRTDASSASDWVLAQDNWNDYSYQTLYHLSHFSIKDGKRQESVIGPVKILKRGQTQSDGILVRENFPELGEEFCSVGDSLDYYERLRAIGPLGEQILASLRDVIHAPELVERFQREPGWRKSLFRDQDDGGSSYRSLATGIVQGHYTTPPKDQQPFEFQVTGWSRSLKIDTRSQASGSGNERLPERVNVLVGRNGSGKSTLLSRLARVAFASTTERAASPLSDLGKMLPEGVGFPRIVVIAFSPFDNFKLPGADARNRTQIAKDMQNGVGRYVFIGLRDFAGEAEIAISDLPGTRLGQLEADTDRVSQTKLKSIADLAIDFDRYRSMISNDSRRELVLKKALDALETGLISDEWLDSTSSGIDQEAATWFMRLSTGHKIAVLSIYGLVACLEDRSLVLIDEPETHLHPPLLSAMMHAFRRVLTRFESSALVATHSPVVVQECLAKHVHVVRREGESFSIRPLCAETFGESIGLITAQVFGMQSDATDFHAVLDRLVDKYDSREKIEKLFLGGVMSGQARAYVMSKLAEDASE